MSWNPDIEDGNIDGGNDTSSDPLDLDNGILVLGYHVDPVDDDLHQTLDFEDPEEQSYKKGRHPAQSGHQLRLFDHHSRTSREVYPIGTSPSKMSHPIMPIPIFERISSHTSIT